MFAQPKLSKGERTKLDVEKLTQLRQYEKQTPLEDLPEMPDEFGMCARCGDFHETADHPSEKKPANERIGYSRDLGLSIIKGVKITYGESTLTEYRHCEVCGGFHETSQHSTDQGDIKIDE